MLRRGEERKHAPLSNKYRSQGLKDLLVKRTTSMRFCREIRMKERTGRSSTPIAGRASEHSTNINMTHAHIVTYKYKHTRLMMAMQT